MANRKNRGNAPRSVASKPVSAAAKPAQPAASTPAKASVTPAPAKAPVTAAEAKPAPAPKATTPAQAVPAAAPMIAAATIATQIEEGTNIMNDQTKKTVDTAQQNAQRTMEAGQQAAQQTAERVQAAFGDINERAKTAMERNAKIMEEMGDLTKGNVEAIVASSRVATQGFQSLGQEAAEFGRRSFEEASATLKSFAEVKSPTDFFRLQGEYARTAFDSMIAESSKMSENVIKIAGDVAEPITNRASVAAEKVKAFAA